MLQPWYNWINDVTFTLSMLIGASTHLNGLHGGDDGDMPPPLPVKKKHSAMYEKFKYMYHFIGYLSVHVSHTIFGDVRFSCNNILFVTGEHSRMGILVGMPVHQLG